MKPAIKKLILEYNNRKGEIRKRLEEFRLVGKRRDEEIFQELCFCLLTANANALRCDEAIRDLRDRSLLLRGSADSLKPRLKGRVRFHNKKASFIIEARKRFKQGGCLDIKNTIDEKNPLAARDWLVDNIKGLGCKEASHFLRNIGLGKELAILDRHILKNLAYYGVIDKVPASLTKKTYMEIEEKMRSFAIRIKIPLAELDLLFWSIETGFVFK